MRLLLSVQEVVLLSADSVEEQQGGALPVEYLNTLLPSELPPHRLTLKIGAPIMLLRNISNRSQGQTMERIGLTCLTCVLTWTIVRSSVQSR